MREKFGKTDLLFTGVLLGICLVVLLVFFLQKGEENGWVIVTRAGEEYGRYPLTEDRTVEITDEAGTVTNVLVIADGKADMQDANCPDRLCVHQREVCRAGENIVCLPNRVVVSVESKREGELDGFAQ